MQYSYQRLLSFLRNAMTILNMLIVVFYGSVILLTTQYIVSTRLARDFLDRITYLPHQPIVAFFGSLMLYGIFIFIMYSRSEKVIAHKRLNFIYSFIEMIVSFTLIYFLYMGYNGILLLVFCDCIFHLRDGRYSKWFIWVLVVAYLISSYDVFSAIFPLTSINEYFQIYGSQINGIFMMSKSCLETLNMILFIAFMLLPLIDKIWEDF